ncbi:type II secretion system F family protein, partial [bacterium]|nr:type II secretion system F family protein [bacterium]
SCVMGVAATVGMWAVSQHVIYALLAGMGFIMLRYLLVIRRRQTRMTKFEELFAQSLEIIGRSLRAGHPFSMGLYMVSTEMPDPVGTEFGIVFQQNQMGLPMEDALACLAVRVPILDVRFFILTVMIHQQTGGDLAEVLDNLSGVIRDRFKIQGQVRALTAEGRLSGWVLSLLPVFVFCIILIMNREYVMVLLTTELGNKMMYSAVGLQIIGMLLIRKIVNIKV